MAYKYYKDNRSFIDACVKTGDAVVVNEEVDWDLEMGRNRPQNLREERSGCLF